MALGEQQVRKIFEKLDIVREVKSVTAKSGQWTEVIPETDISKYKFKTVSIRADYGLTFRWYMYDDPAEFREDDPYIESDLTANRTLVKSSEEDFKYTRVRVYNPDTADHVVEFCRIKGRRV